MGRGQTQKKAGEVVAVAIDNDKGSQHALKWTIDSLVTRGQALTLLQVRQRTAIPTQTTKEVERGIEKGTFAEMLDPAVPDWPVEEALKFAKLALQCAELRRKDRPDLGKVVLPELNRLRALANDRTNSVFLGGGGECSPRQSSTPTIQDVISDGDLSQPGYESSRSRSSTSSYPGRKIFLD